MSQTGADQAMVRRFIDALQTGAETSEIAVDPAIADALGAHYALLVKWASRINLTTVVDPREAAHRHAVDSLFFAEFFDSVSKETVADIGSGGGFPGIILAVARPSLAMHLYEPTRKRASFLRVVLTALGRDDVAVHEERLDKTGDWKVDAIVSRATIPPLELIPLASLHLNTHGRLITTSGRSAPDLADVRAAALGCGLEFVRRVQHALPDGEPRFLDELRLFG